MCYAIIHHLILKTILEPTNQKMSAFFSSFSYVLWQPKSSSCSSAIFFTSLRGKTWIFYDKHYNGWLPWSKPPEITQWCISTSNGDGFLTPRWWLGVATGFCFPLISWTDANFLELECHFLLSCHKILRNRNAMFQHLQWPFPVYMRCLVFSSYGAFWGANKSIISMVSFTKGLAKLVLIASISVMERLLDAQKGGGNCVFFSPFFEWECGLLGTPKERFEPRPSGMYFF